MQIASSEKNKAISSQTEERNSVKDYTPLDGLMVLMLIAGKYRLHSIFICNLKQKSFSDIKYTFLTFCG